MAAPRLAAQQAGAVATSHIAISDPNLPIDAARTHAHVISTSVLAVFRAFSPPCRWRTYVYWLVYTVSGAAGQYLGESLSERLHIMTVPSPESHWFESRRLQHPCKTVGLIHSGIHDHTCGTRSTETARRRPRWSFEHVVAQIQAASIARSCPAASFAAARCDSVAKRSGMAATCSSNVVTAICAAAPSPSASSPR
eukprot:COSAG02_NODE_17330_length_1012_cov_0.904710_2_plen_196_part_00